MKKAILKELERVYLKVLEKFPEIKKNELKLKYMSDFEYVSFLMIDDEKYLKKNKMVIDPSIIAGTKFLEFSEEEKETSISHELGHYTRYRGKSAEKVKRNMLYASVLNAYAGNPAIWTVEELSSDFYHKMKRVKKWYFMQEKYADNKVVDAGYGNVLLNILKKHLDKYNMILAPVHREEINIRIKNLEEKLRS